MLTVARIGFVLLTLCVGCARATPDVRATRGQLDLSQARLDQASVALEGEWAFFWRELPAPAELLADPARIAGARPIRAPAAWNDFQHAGRPIGARGYGTYALELQLPADSVGRTLALRLRPVNTAAEIFVNGQRVGGAGRTGTAVESSEAALRPITAYFQSETARVQITVRVSNFDHRSGGLRESIRLAHAEVIALETARALFADAFLFGGILLMGLYHLGLYWNRREDRASLYFGFFCLLIAARVAFTGEYYAANAWPDMSYRLQRGIEYATVFLSAPAFLTFLNAAFPTRPGLYVARGYQAAGLAFLAATALLEPYDSSRILVYFQLLLILGGVYSLALLAYAVRDRRAGARSSLAGATLFVAAVIHDVAAARGLVQNAYLTPIGLIAFIFAQSYLLARIFAGAFLSIRRISEAYARFVPREFLDQLERSDITQIELGDQVEKEMTVLFSDIRSFTSLSEGMSPRENFNFINAYLGRMSPIVKAHGGFVDKYIGDAVMALFPNSPDDALAAAVEMQREIGRYNERRRAKGFRAIQVGIGLHHGRLMLGTIGAEERMEGTVISDAVNLASRIEDLSREYGSGILLSDAALARLTDPSRYRMRLVDRVQVKGKRNAVSVYEALEGLPEEVIALRLATRGDFEAGVIAFVSGDEASAERFMLRVLAAAPDDPAALYYLRRSTHQSRTAS